MENIAELVKSLQRERDALNQAIAVLVPLSGRNGAGLSPGRLNGTGRRLSVAARRRIAAAQRARWAKVHAASKTVGIKSTGNGKRRAMSAAARRKIAAAQRARWAKIRRGQEKAA